MAETIFIPFLNRSAEFTRGWEAAEFYHRLENIDREAPPGEHIDTCSGIFRNDNQDQIFLIAEVCGWPVAGFVPIEPGPFGSFSASFNRRRA